MGMHGGHTRSQTTQRTKCVVVKIGFRELFGLLHPRLSHAAMFEAASSMVSMFAVASRDGFVEGC